MLRSVSSLDEIALLNIFLGIMASIGLAYIMFLLLNVFPYFKKSRTLMLIQVIGGLSVLLGIWALRIVNYTKESLNSVYPLLVLAGMSMIILPLVKLRLFKFDRSLILQALLILLSLFPYTVVHVPWNFVPGTFVLAAILFLIRFPLFLTCLSPLGMVLVNIASWLWVIFAWLRYYLIQTPPTCMSYALLLIPVTSLLLWDFSVIISYENTRRWL